MIAIAAKESGLDQEFISDLNTNAPTILYDLYLSTDVVKQAVIAQEQMIRKIADNGACVIVGRAADYILRDYDKVINVFVYASKDYRIKNIMKMYNDDLETAKTFLHPDSTPKRDNLSSYIEKLETTHSIDFSLGVAFKSTTGFSSTYYNSIYDGSVHEASYKIVVGGVSVKCFFTVVKNDNGYGIYSFGIEK